MKWASTARTGDLYPFAGVPVTDDDLRFKQKAGGVISKKVRGGEVFARSGDKAGDVCKGADAVRLVAAIKELQKIGKKVNRIAINEARHALYREAGRLFFVCALDVGLEFPEMQREIGALA